MGQSEDHESGDNLPSDFRDLMHQCLDHLLSWRLRRRGRSECLLVTRSLLNESGSADFVVG